MSDALLIIASLCAGVWAGWVIRSAKAQEERADLTKALRWLVRAFELGPTAVAADVTLSALTHAYAAIAKAGIVCKIDFWKDRAEVANARLIAAAPDLLACLKKARSYYIETTNCRPTDWDAAIAKAEGGQ